MKMGTCGTPPVCSGSRTKPSTTGTCRIASAMRRSPSGRLSASSVRSRRPVRSPSLRASPAGERVSASANKTSITMTRGRAAAIAPISRATTARGNGHGPSFSSERRSISTIATGLCGSIRSARRNRPSNARTRSNPFWRNVSRQSPGSRTSVAQSRMSAMRPKTRGDLPARTDLTVVMPGNRGELAGIAEHAIDGTADRACFLERAECLVDLGARRAEQERELTLREPDLERDPLAGNGLALAERDQEEAREPDMERMQRDRFQLVAGVAHPPAEKIDEAAGDRGLAAHELAQDAPLQRPGDDGVERHRLRAARAAVERADLAEDLGRGDVAEAELAPFIGRGRDPHAPLRDQVQMIAGVAAGEQHLALAEAHLAKILRQKLQLGIGEAAKQLGLRQQRHDLVGFRHRRRYRRLLNSASMRFCFHRATRAGRAPVVAMAVPSPACSVTVRPPACTETSPRSTKTASALPSGPTKTCVPRTAINP